MEQSFPHLLIFCCQGEVCLACRCSQLPSWDGRKLASWLILHRGKQAVAAGGKAKEDATIVVEEYQASQVCWHYASGAVTNTPTKKTGRFIATLQCASLAVIAILALCSRRQSDAWECTF